MTSVPFQQQQTVPSSDAASGESCPHCGFPLARARDTAAVDVESRRRKVENERRTAELAREVQHLRATVARLRGTGASTH